MEYKELYQKAKIRQVRIWSSDHQEALVKLTNHLLQWDAKTKPGHVPSGLDPSTCPPLTLNPGLRDLFTNENQTTKEKL